jgi:hypothetical protein
MLVCLCVASSASAQAIRLGSADDAGTPYLLSVYDCDWTKPKTDASRFSLPVNDKPSADYLIVSKQRYSAAGLEGLNNWLAFAKTDKNTVQMESKVQEFELSGNISAMKHWQDKLTIEMKTRMAYFEQLAFQKVINEELAKTGVPRYFQPSWPKAKMYATQKEMQEDVGAYCNP